MKLINAINKLHPLVCLAVVFVGVMAAGAIENMGVVLA